MITKKVNADLKNIKIYRLYIVKRFYDSVEVIR